MKPYTMAMRKFDADTLTIEVTVTREFKLRIWLAVHLIRLACAIAGCGIAVTAGE